MLLLNLAFLPNNDKFIFFEKPQESAAASDGQVEKNPQSIAAIDSQVERSP